MFIDAYIPLLSIFVECVRVHVKGLSCMREFKIVQVTITRPQAS